MGSAEVTQRLAETRALAQAMGISGTPTFVLEDRMLRGYLPRADMEAVIAEAREEAGVE
jgi:protein-disulfide isomerase